MNYVARVYDEQGYLTAIKKHDGDLIPNIYTEVGKPCVGWDEVTAKKVVWGTIVWDGGCHQQLTGWYDSKAPGAPRGGMCGLYFKGLSDTRQRPGMQTLQNAEKAGASWDNTVGVSEDAV